MMKIKSIHGIEVLDSRGVPTIGVQIFLENSLSGVAFVPSGASTGMHEALELRDGDPKRYFGKGVRKAIANINGPIQKRLIGHDIFDQVGIDRALIELDGTPNKSHLGANAILGVSLAAIQTAAKAKNLPLYAYLLGKKSPSFPMPMMNILNGGEHANNELDFQEFMIRPIGFSKMSERIRVGAEVFHTLKGLLLQKGFSTAVGDEGGFAPNLRSEKEALDLVSEAIQKAGFKIGKEVSIALDIAANYIFDEGSYFIHKKGGNPKKRSSTQQVDFICELVKAYPIDSIEDALAETDREGWKLLTQELGRSIQLVGDDIFVTNPLFLQRGIREQLGNAVLIKPNQIGTLTETLETIAIAEQHGYAQIISHRSGETEDTSIADLAVATEGAQIKCGSLSRSERVAKYNRLIFIEESLSKEH